MRGGQAVRDYIEQRIDRMHCGHPTPCWIWKLRLDRKGYAVNAIPCFGRRKHRVHRAAYEAYIGPIPDGLQIDHLCRIKSCVNPLHLEPVTPEENLDRQHSAGPTPAQPGKQWRPGRKGDGAHCGRGHLLTDENVRLEAGYRRCRICRRLSNANSRRKNGAQPTGGGTGRPSADGVALMDRTHAERTLTP